MSRREFCRINKKAALILRIIAIILLAFMLLRPLASISLDLRVYAAVTSGTSGTDEALGGNDLTAVYAHGGYSVRLDNAVYLDGGKDDGKMLTDRVYTSVTARDEDEPITGWMMVKSKDGKSGFSLTVDIDIGHISHDVCRFYLRAFKNDVLQATMPDSIDFYASENGRDYAFVGRAKTYSDVTAKSCAAIYGVTLSEGIDARYIRAVIESESKELSVWINEIGAASRTELEYTTSADGRIYDGNGIIYRVDKGVASVIGFDPRPSSSQATKSNADFNCDEGSYVLGLGTGNAVKVIPDFIDEGRINYSGVPNNVKYIIIHNTGTTEEDTDAARYNHRIHTTDGETSWHYTVDDKLIYHSLADSDVGWHAGSGLNYESIGIEICVNGAPTRSGEAVFKGSAYEKWVEERFDRSLRNTAVLVAELLTRYRLAKDAVIQHYDSTEKNCPQWLRYKDGKYVYDGTLWERFMGYVSEYYDMLNLDSPNGTMVLKTDIVIPDHISVDGAIYPVTEIASNALADIEAPIRSITIGNEITRVGTSCFDGNADLENVYVGNKNQAFRVDGDKTVYSRDGSTVFDPSAYVSITPSPKSNCTLDIQGIDGKYYVFEKSERFTLAELADKYGAESFTAHRMDGRLVAPDEIPGTGTVLCFDGARMYLVLIGDANGDASIDKYDYILIKRTCLNTYSPLKRQTQAMILRDADSVSVYDYIIHKRHVMGTFDIFNK